MIINLGGLEDKFTASGPRLCAVCGRNFDEVEGDDYDDDDVPLLLWKEGGKLMLTLCMACAANRIQTDPK